MENEKTRQEQLNFNEGVCEKCNIEMLAVGLGDCNGFECPICGNFHLDIASYKMNNFDDFEN